MITVSLIILSCKPNIQELRESIENEDIVKVNRIIERGVMPSENELRLAISKKNYNLIEVLIENIIDPELKIQDFNLLLNIKYRPLLYKLIDKGMRTNIEVREGLDLAEWAIKYNKQDILKKVIESGADINSDRGGYNLFTLVLKKFDLDLIELMINHGADLYWMDDEGQLIFSKLIVWRRKEVILYLIERGYDISSISNSTYDYDPWQELALYWEDGYISVADYYWDNGLRFKENCYALHTAGVYLNLEFAEWLLGHGADVNLVNDLGNTPSYYVAISTKQMHNATIQERKEIMDKKELFYDLLDRYQ